MCADKTGHQGNNYGVQTPGRLGLQCIVNTSRPESVTILFTKLSIQRLMPQPSAVLHVVVKASRPSAMLRVAVKALTFSNAGCYCQGPDLQQCWVLL